jgi:thiamine-monophosphate kinase
VPPKVLNGCMENEFINWLKTTLAEQTSTNTGIGDDAAVFTTPPGLQQLLTSDCLVDQVHFDVNSTSLYLIGRKSVAASISDIAAMCGVPKYVIISIVAPRTFALDDLKNLYEGMVAISDAFNCSIIGGDFISHDGPLTINVTILGLAKQDQLRFRFDTEVNDSIFVSGTLGGSRSGHHLTFDPRVELGLILGGNQAVHSLTDITDGLVLDLHSILMAGNYGATLLQSQIPTSPHLAHDKSAVSAALYDGEDFELLFTASSDYQGHLENKSGDVVITKIGYINQDPEILLMTESGDTIQLDVRGYSH